MTCAAAFRRSATASLFPVSHWNDRLLDNSGQSSGAPRPMPHDLGDRRHGPPVHRDQLGGIARRQRVLGDDEGDRLADVAHALDRQGILLSQRHLGAIGIQHFEAAFWSTKEADRCRRHEDLRWCKPPGRQGRGARLRRRCRRSARAHAASAPPLRALGSAGRGLRCTGPPVRKRWSSRRGKGLPIKVSMARIPRSPPDCAATPRADFLTGPVARSLQAHRPCQTFLDGCRVVAHVDEGRGCPGRAAAGKLSIGIQSIECGGVLCSSPSAEEQGALSSYPPSPAARRYVK